MTVDPLTGTIPVGYLILNTASVQLKQHRGGCIWTAASSSTRTHSASEISDSTAAGRGP